MTNACYGAFWVVWNNIFYKMCRKIKNWNLFPMVFNDFYDYLPCRFHWLISFSFRVWFFPERDFFCNIQYYIYNAKQHFLVLCPLIHRVLCVEKKGVGRGGNSRRTSGISDGIYITAGRMIFKNCKNVRRRNFRQKQTERKSKYS